MLSGRNQDPPYPSRATSPIRSYDRKRTSLREVFSASWESAPLIASFSHDLGMTLEFYLSWPGPPVPSPPPHKNLLTEPLPSPSDCTFLVSLSSNIYTPLT